MPVLITPNEVNEVVRLLKLDPQEAIGEGQRLIQRSGSVKDAAFVQLCNLMAAAAIRLRKFDLAEKLIADGLAVDRNPHLLNTLASIYREKGDQQQALLAIDEAILIQGDSPEFYRTKAIVLFEGGRYSQLRQLLNEVLTTPFFASLRHLYLGAMAWREGRFEKAEADLEKSIELSPAVPDAYVELTQLYQQHGQHHKAIETIQKLQKSTGQLTEFQLALLAMAYYETEDTVNAEHVARQALAINPVNLPAITTLAKIDTIKGKEDAAINKLERLLREELPDHLLPQIHRGLGDNHEIKQDYNAAFKAYRTANTIAKRLISNQLDELTRAGNKLILDSRRYPAHFKTLSRDTLTDDNHHFIIGLPGPDSGLLAELAGDQPGVKVHVEHPDIVALLQGTLPEAAFAKLAADLNSDRQNVYWDPRFIFMLPDIKLRFPEATIILFTQHPKAVCVGAFSSAGDSSAYTVPFLEWPATVDWVSAMITAWFTFAQQAAEQHHRVSIERLVSKPGETLKQLLEFLQVKDQPLISEKALRRCRDAQQRSLRWVGYSAEIAPYPPRFIDDCAKLGYLESK